MLKARALSLAKSALSGGELLLLLLLLQLLQLLLVC